MMIFVTIAENGTIVRLFFVVGRKLMAFAAPFTWAVASVSSPFTNSDAFIFQAFGIFNTVQTLLLLLIALICPVGSRVTGAASNVYLKVSLLEHCLGTIEYVTAATSSCCARPRAIVHSMI
jgi:hypothetical protein